MLKRITILLALSSLAMAQGILTPQERKAGWMLLFDGKTFANWLDPAKMTPAGDGWAIVDGFIKPKPHPSFTEDLVSVGKYGDFELTWDWKISPGGNSGLKYRIQEFVPIATENRTSNKFEDTVEDAANRGTTRAKAAAEKGTQSYVVGFEYQMIDDDKHKDAQRGPLYQTGSLYSMIPRTKQAAKPVGEINHSRLVVKGVHIEHWLNGEKVVDASLMDPVIGEGLAKRWGTTSKVYNWLVKQPRKECWISLQNHGDEAWFNNIKIRKL